MMDSNSDHPLNRRDTVASSSNLASRSSLEHGFRTDTSLNRSFSTDGLKEPTSDKMVDTSLSETAVDYRRYELLVEFASLRNASVCPTGVYVMPALDTLYLWYGVIFIHKGYYQGAVLKFRLDIPKSYPAFAPTVTFITDTFHPLVDQRGRFGIEAKFPKWVPQRDHIVDILRFLKASFKVGVLNSLTEDSCLNKQAYRMYHLELDLFIRLSEQCAKVSTADSVVFDDYPEGNTICFKPISEGKFEDIFSQLSKTSSSSSSRMRDGVSTLESIVSKIKKTLAS